MAVKVKICGLTRREDIEAVNEYGTDAAGFVLGVEKSKRNIELAKAARLMQGLDESIRKVAVTISPSLDFVKEIEQAGFDILQVHGRLEKEILDETNLKIWRAVNIKDSLEEYDKACRLPAIVEAIVLDGAVAGSGKTFQWDQVDIENIRPNNKMLVLAGGLNAQNVAQGIKNFHPDYVDVSSGVEGNKGKEKDKIKEFIMEVRQNG